MAAEALKMMEEKILEKYVLADEYYDQELDVFQYRILDKITHEEKAEIELSFSKDATVTIYNSNNHWFSFSNSATVTVPVAINVRWLISHEKGVGSLMLAYGVLKMKSKDEHDVIEYSILDDDSKFSTRKKKNIYSKFGYTPVEAVKNMGKNTVKLQGPEKQVLLTDFVNHVNRMFLSARNSPNSRGRSRSRRGAEEPNASGRYATRSKSRRGAEEPNASGRYATRSTSRKRAER